MKTENRDSHAELARQVRRLRKEKSLRHYYVKARGAVMQLLDRNAHTYDEAKCLAVKLGGIVTNRSFAKANGML